MEETDRSDAELLRSRGAQASSNFDTLMRRHGPALYRYAWALARHQQEVEDTVQETFLLLWRKRKHVRFVDGSLLPWLLVSCKNITRNRQRREAKRSHVPLDTVSSVLAGEGGSEGEHAAELRWVLEDIDRLGELDRYLITACLVEGRGYAEVAADVGLNPAAARQRIHRARGKLQALKAGREA